MARQSKVMDILQSFSAVKVFVFDVDGVLTDGSLLLAESGEWLRRMNIKDGYALQLAVKKGYRVLIISGGHSDAVKMRLQKLGIREVLTAVTDKRSALKNYIDEFSLAREQVLYMGDDIPDIAPMEIAGLACSPADAVPEIHQASAYISPKKGGDGCVRDVIEKVMKLQGNWNEHPEVSSI